MNKLKRMMRLLTKNKLPKHHIKSFLILIILFKKN